MALVVEVVVQPYQPGLVVAEEAVVALEAMVATNDAHPGKKNLF
jgi:hypothetical protein